MAGANSKEPTGYCPSIGWKREKTRNKKNDEDLIFKILYVFQTRLFDFIEMYNRQMLVDNDALKQFKVKR